MRLTVAMLALVAAACTTPLAHQQELQRAPEAADAGSQSVDEVCEPGTFKGCFCAIGEPAGERWCLDNGSGWRACECPGLPDAGAPGDAGELADAAAESDAAVDAVVEPAPGEFWAPCETWEDCTGSAPNYGAPIPLKCFPTDRVGAPGKRCTFPCIGCEQACDYGACTNLGGSCQLIDQVSGTTVTSFFVCVP